MTESSSRRLPPVLILAAGKGTRLGAIGRQRPKALLPVDGRPLLDLHLDHLAAEGVDHVVVNAHHLADQISDHVARYRGPLRTDVVVEEALLGTAGAAINALPTLGGRTFLVVYGDVIIFEHLVPLVETHSRSKATATLCVYEHAVTHDKGVVEVDPDGRVTAFAEKDPERAGPGLVNAGLYVVEPSLFDGFASGRFLDFGHDVFPAALRAGQHLQVHRLARPVLDIGTPRDLAQAGSPPVPDRDAPG